MDQQELENLIVERFDNLQPEIQAVIMDPNYEKQVVDIAQKYNLSKEQTSDLEINTTLVLLGNTHPDEYSKELTEDLKLAPVVVKQIVDDINQTVLKNILGMIKQNFKEDDEKEAAVTRTSELKLDPKFSTLPKELQDAIAQSDYQKKLYDIGTKYKLQVEKMGKFEEQTVKFIRGSISGSQYENNLALELEFEAGKARELATEVNESIMKNIRESMKKNASILETPAVVNIPSEDIVPLPPYSSKPTKTIVIETKPVEIPAPAISAPVKPMSPHDMYAEHGVEILDDSVAPKIEKKEEIKTAPVENITMKESGIDMLKEKLDGITVSKQTVSDHSLSHDPYHEEI
jgi:hypothetical protein